MVEQAQFPPPLPGLRGFGSGASGLGRIAGLPAFSVVDKVVVPPTLKPGKYLLSWRWDCEQVRRETALFDAFVALGFVVLGDELLAHSPA